MAQSRGCLKQFNTKVTKQTFNRYEVNQHMLYWIITMGTQELKQDMPSKMITIVNQQLCPTYITHMQEKD